MMFARLGAHGASMVVVDGAVRDCSVMAKLPFPIFARGAPPNAFMGERPPWEADLPIRCGGALVRPGDSIIADTDGLVVMPQAMGEAIASELEAKAASDAFSQALLRAGLPLDDCYPLPTHMLSFFDRFSATGVLPDAQTVAQARRTGSAAQ